MTASENTVFAKIIKGELPAEKVFESDSLIAIRDISPVAPVHILIIPKKYIKDVSKVTKGDEALVGEMVLTAKKIAQDLNIHESGYRLVFNCGDDAGMLVPHLHLHLIGGKKLGNID